MAELLKHTIVSSPAGSGKTESLVKRYLFLLKKGFSPQYILAITFTNQAAAEMKNRILTEIEKGEIDPKLWHDFREGKVSFRVSTIHSFFAELLFRFSLECGLPPNFDVMSQVEKENLIGGVIEDALLKLAQSGDSVLKEALSKWELKQLKSILNFLLKNRPLSDDWAQQHSQERDDQDSFLAHLFRVVLQVYQAKKARLGKVDFADLEVLVWQFLEQSGDINEVLLYFNEHIYQLLIDEFQDTSLLQWKIVGKLVEDWLAGQGLRESTEASLYLVGDPKQSIYRFRGADIEVFQEVRKFFEAQARSKEGQKHYELPQVVRENYRSLPAIVSFVNSFFQEVMAEGDAGSVPYESLVATREGNGVVEILVVEKADKEKTAELKEREAQLVSTRLAQLLEENGVQPGDIAILFPSRTHLKAFEKHLKKQSIPYLVEQGRGFFNRDEVKVFIFLLSFLAKPFDDLSLFALLRSDLFKYPEEEMTQVITRGGRCLWQKWSNWVEKEKPRQAWLVYQLLKSWLKKKDWLSPLELLLLAIEETGAYAVFHLPFQQANLDKLVSLVGMMSLKTQDNLNMVADWLNSLSREEEAEGEVGESDSSYVHLMTIHAAKGLQFPYVFVVDIDSFATAKSGPFYLDKDKKGVLRFAFSKDEELKNLARRKSLEEKKRQLYVACTRAQDGLFLSLTLKNNSKKSAARFWERLVEKENGEVVSPYGARVIQGGQLCSKDVKKVKIEVEEPPSVVFIEPLTEKADLREALPPSHFFFLKSEAAKVGEVIHKIFEELARGSLEEDVLSIKKRLAEIVWEKELLNLVEERFLHDWEKLRRADLVRLITAKGGLVEHPFLYLEGDSYQTGRMDRVLFRGDEVWVIDYKTDQLEKEEIETVASQYLSQLKAYRQAAQALWEGKKVRTFLLFTYLGEMVELDLSQDRDRVKIRRKGV